MCVAIAISLTHHGPTLCNAGKVLKTKGVPLPPVPLLPMFYASVSVSVSAPTRKIIMLHLRAFYLHFSAFNFCVFLFFA